MIEQFDFDFSPILPDSEDNSLVGKFNRFHAKNPHVYSNLVKLARQFRSKRPNGIVGASMLLDILRWNFFMNVDSDEDFKFPNAFAAGYARIIMKQEPDLDGIFKLHKSAFNE
jgi:hypothetical protein